MHQPRLRFIKFFINLFKPTLVVYLLQCPPQFLQSPPHRDFPFFLSRSNALTLRTTQPITTIPATAVPNIVSIFIPACTLCAVPSAIFIFRCLLYKIHSKPTCYLTYLAFANFFISTFNVLLSLYGLTSR